MRLFSVFPLALAISAPNCAHKSAQKGACKVAIMSPGGGNHDGMRFDITARECIEDSEVRCREASESGEVACLLYWRSL